jgi:hypothetical protein
MISFNDLFLEIIMARSRNASVGKAGLYPFKRKNTSVNTTANLLLASKKHWLFTKETK